MAVENQLYLLLPPLTLLSELNHEVNYHIKSKTAKIVTEVMKKGIHPSIQRLYSPNRTLASSFEVS
jgi:hypothetical protein